MKTYIITLLKTIHTVMLNYRRAELVTVMLNLFQHPLKLSTVILILIFATPFFALSQTPQISYELNQNESGSDKTYIARDYIKLQQGFKFNSSDGHKFVAKLDENLLFPVNYGSPFTSNNFSINTNLQLGTTAGSLNVSETGAANYSVPILVSPGTNGLQPQISVNYNSQSGNGLLGWGWNISGLSVITRTGKTFYHDGKATGIKFNEEDRFLLDGNRLQIINGNTYGDDGAEYRTEIETFSKIISHGTSGVGPEWFEVKTKGGLTIEYGHQPNGAANNSKFPVVQNSSIIVWYINKITDAQNNYMTFSYQEIDGNIYIKNILYTGNELEGLLPYNKVNFIYENRIDKSTKYSNGIEINNSVVLRSIKTFSSGSLLREYKFNYSQKPQNTNVAENYSFLNEIVEISNGKQYNSLKFQYGDMTPPLVQIPAEPDISDAVPPEFVSTGDYDGNGLTDMIYFYQDISNGKWTSYDLYLNKNGSFNNVLHHDIGAAEYIVPFDPEKSSYIGSRSLDLNGDGKDELLLGVNDPSPGNPHINYQSYIFNETTNSFDNENIFATNYPSNNEAALHGDYDGNGQIDLFVYESVSHEWQLFLNNNPTPVEGTFSYPGDLSKDIDPQNPVKYLDGNLSTIDIDGDGITEIEDINTNGDSLILKFDFTDSNNPPDLILIHNEPHSLIVPLETYYGDFNGDGIYEKLVREVIPGLVNLSNQYKAPPDPNDTTPPPPDVYGYHTKWNVKYGTGNYNTSGLYTEPNLTAQDAQIGVNYNTDHFYINLDENQLIDNTYKVVVGDFNGDGLSDIAQLHDYRSDVILVNRDRIDIKILFSDGKNGFIEKNMEAHSGLSYNYNFNNEYINFEFPTGVQITSGDFDGNGSEDILIHERGVKLISINQYSKDAFLLKSVYNGLGNLTEISYKPLTNTDVYSQNSSNNYSFPIITKKTSPMYVVSSINEPDGIGGISTNQYHYGGMVVHYQGRGFLTFENITISNTVNDRKILKSFQVNPAYYMLSSSLVESRLISTNELLSTSSNTFTFFPYNSALGQKRVFRYMGTSTNNDVLKGVEEIQTNTYNTSDEFGNLSGSTVTLNGTAYTETTSYADYISDGSWCPSKPGQISNIKILNGKPAYEKKVKYEYYNNGLPHFVKVDFDKPAKAVTGELIYDNFGNNTYVKVSSTDVTDIKQIKNEYDATKRFVIKTINPAGFVTKATYDTRLGVVKTQTDINNRTTNFVYDDFGNLIKTIAPTGIESVYDKKWNDFPYLANALFYTLEKSVYSNNDISPYIKKYYDNLGREIRSLTNAKAAYNSNKSVCINTTYNNIGQVISQSQPFFLSLELYPLITTYTYYPDGRPYQVNEVNGSQTTYSYNLLTTTISNSGTGQDNVTTTNVLGQPVSVTDNSGTTVEYEYLSNGQPENITSDGSVTTMTYDDYGRQTSVNDPNAGTVNFAYNGLGQLISQTDNKGNIYTMLYDALGRLTTKNGPEGEYNYTYDLDPNNKGTLSKIISPNETVLYAYDNFGRIVQTTKKIQGLDFVSDYTYNNLSRLVGETYPTNPLNPAQRFAIQNIYDNLGFIKEVKNMADNQTIWYVPENAYNSKGQLTELTLGNGLSMYSDYNNLGLLNYIKTGTTQTTGLVQNYAYTFDTNWGRPITRTNAFGGVDISGNTFSVTENFGYDEDFKKLNRLTSVNVSSADVNYNTSRSMAMAYQTNGNILFKTGIGNYSYTGQQTQAVTAIDNTNSIVSTDKQEIDYTAFNKVNYIKEKFVSGTNYEKELYFTYGADNQRVKTEYQNNQILEKTKYFAGNFELEITPLGTRELNYIAGPAGLAAVFVKDNSSPNGQLFYTHTDHLGSITEITDNTGALVQRMAYNAWGKRELLADNTGTGNYLFDRGYTSHEHLDQFSLINMNGRLYDPVLGRMLSPDPFIQDPANSQNFNRYSYCLNNPMVYTDPSGYAYNGGGSSGGGSYYIDGLQVSAGIFNLWMSNPLNNQYSYTVEGYGDVYEDYHFKMLDLQMQYDLYKLREKAEFRLKQLYPDWEVNRALMPKSSFGGDPPLKNNNQSTTTATIPNFVPTIRDFNFETGNSFGQIGGSSGGDNRADLLTSTNPIVDIFKAIHKAKSNNKLSNLYDVIKPNYYGSGFYNNYSETITMKGYSFKIRAIGLDENLSSTYYNIYQMGFGYLDRFSKHPQIKGYDEGYSIGFFMIGYERNNLITIGANSNEGYQYLLNLFKK